MRFCDMWAEMLDEARKLSDADLRRHASVSRNNNHRCVECFCCACVVVRQEREHEHPDDEKGA